MRCIHCMLACLSVACARCEEVDSWVMHAVEVSSRVIDSPEYGRMILDASLRKCQYDTNRYARILARMAQTNDVRVANVAISRLGAVGGSSELPFLYSCATNPALRECSMYSILQVENCTEQSVGLFATFLSDTNFTQQVRSDFACEMYRATYKDGIPETNRVLGAACMLNYAATANHCFVPLDKAILWRDPAYRHSKRRLAVLRSVRDLGMQPYPLAYVTNAINELVAYPEADLPD